MTADTKSAKDACPNCGIELVWPDTSAPEYEDKTSVTSLCRHVIRRTPPKYQQRHAESCQGCEDERTDPQGQHTHAEGAVEHPITICDERLRHIVYGGQDGWRLKPNTREAELMAAELLALRARPSVAAQSGEGGK